MKLHVHAILIALIVFILFPTVWVVTTSLRRDEAAFSTELFSSRLTLQNYIDLLFPEQNVPVLIKELQKLVSRVEPYDKLNLPQAQQKATELLKKLRRYLDESSRRNELAKNAYKDIVKIFEEGADRVKQTTLGDLKRIEEVVVETQDELKINEDELTFVLYEALSKERFNSQLEKTLRSTAEKLTNIRIEDEEAYSLALEYLKQVYEKFGGSALKELETLTTQLSSLTAEIDSMRRSLEPLERSFVEVQILLKGDVLTELQSLSIAIDALTRMKDSLARTTAKSIFPVEDSAFLKSVKDVSNRLDLISTGLEGFEDLSEVEKAARTLSKNLLTLTEVEPEQKSLKVYGDMVRAYDEIRPRLERLCDDMENVLDRYRDYVLKIREANEFFSAERISVAAVQTKNG